MLSKASEIRETKTRISYVAALSAATMYSIQKPSTWLMFRVFHLRDELVVTNSMERVYYVERQILALLLVRQTHKLSCIKFPHIS